ALVLGLALLPAVPPLRLRLIALTTNLRVRTSFPPHSDGKVERTPRLGSPRGLGVLGAVVIAVLLAVIAVGYPVQRHYLRDRYADPSFSTPGLDAAFAWARDISGARIATTSTRQYPLFGTDLSNRVAYLGTDRPHGGFEAAPHCAVFRRLVYEVDYDYVVASRDRIESGKPAFPPQARWTEGPNAEVVLRKKPTVVFRISGPLDPKTCP